MSTPNERDPVQLAAPETGPDRSAAPGAQPAAAPAPAPEAAAPAPPAPAPAAPPPGPVPGTPPGRTRLGGTWVLLTSGAAVLVLLLVFILQNSQHVEVHIYGAHWNAPLGVALLMAAALGVLLVVVPGAGRMIQLRRAARRAHQRATDLERVATARTDTGSGS